MLFMNIVRVSPDRGDSLLAHPAQARGLPEAQESRRCLAHFRHTLKPFCDPPGAGVIVMWSPKCVSCMSDLYFGYLDLCLSVWTCILGVNPPPHGLWSCMRRFSLCFSLPLGDFGPPSGGMHASGCCCMEVADMTIIITSAWAVDREFFNVYLFPLASFG